MAYAPLQRQPRHPARHRAAPAMALAALLSLGILAACAGLPAGSQAGVSNDARGVVVSTPPAPAVRPSDAPAPDTAPGEAAEQVSADAAANPWGYYFSQCTLIYDPPADFCRYFACIKNFPNGTGYVIQCKDGMFSKSGGRQGSCSYHGGNLRPLCAPSAQGPALTAAAAPGVMTPVPPGTPPGACDPSYPTVCIPPPPPDLNCGDIPYSNFTVHRPDPHHFDGDGDGVGCER